MGRIIDLLADRDSKVVAAVIEFGGFLGIGTRKIAVEWSALRIEADKSPVAILDVTREQLRVTPEYKPDRPAAVFRVNQAGITRGGRVGAYCQTDVTRASAGGPASLKLDWYHSASERRRLELEDPVPVLEARSLRYRVRSAHPSTLSRNSTVTVSVITSPPSHGRRGIQILQRRIPPF